MGAALDKQAAAAKRLDSYYAGDHPIPDAVKSAKAASAYKLLMSLARSNWPKLIVDSVEERLEVQAIKFADETASKDAWLAWQRNGLDADQGLVHSSALTTGRAYVIVWADENGEPLIFPEHASMVIVEYAPSSRRKRIAALRRWWENDYWHATLYKPDAIYKFRSKVKDESGKRPPSDTEWVAREVSGENWPLANPIGTVPVVEISVNRSLMPSRYGTAQGEFESACQQIDRINYTTFSQLAAMTWSGFPLRAMIGDPIAYEDDNVTPIQPFDVAQDRIVQIENPDGKLLQLPEASLGNYGSVNESNIKHLAAITKTPAHYLLGEMVNLSADAIRAGEAGLTSKTYRHHRPIGEGWEEVSRLALRIKNPSSKTADDPSVEVAWRDPESRSLAERADAATKLASTNLPWQFIGEKVFNLSPQEIQEIDALRGSDVLAEVLSQQAPIAA